MTPPDSTVEFSRRCRHCGGPLAPTSSFCSKCGATAQSPSESPDELREKVQQLFGADLELERELGRGGMAVVYAAFDPALQRRVAVKVLLPDMAGDQSMADRFLREARTVAALQHPHVVTVYAVRSGAGANAIVMQFVEGRSLDAILKDRGVLPMHVAGMILSHVAAGLQHAHDRGVIHRDVKPANVLIDHEGRATVSDFGIARRDGGPRLTDTGLVLGTWAYMSPEQRSAAGVMAETDQYSLGVMAFELLTGRLPFTGKPAEMMRAHMYDAPPSLREIRLDVSPAVEALVLRMLAKKPEERWPSLREAERAFGMLAPNGGQTTLMLASLSKVSQRAGGSVVMDATAPMPRTTPHVPTIELPPATQPPAARKKSVVVPVVSAAAVIVIALALWLTMRPDGGQTASPPTSAPRGTASSATMQPSDNAAAPAEPMANAPSAAPPVRQSQSPSQPLSVNPTSAEPPRLQADEKSAMPAGARLNPATLAAMPGTPATTTPSAPAAATPTAPAATVADARRLGREFVTMLNQRRSRELAQIPQVGGDAGARAELISLTESASDFAAGFDRVPSTPGEWTNGFETEFVLDLEWRGGKKLLHVHLYASPGPNGWKTVGLGVTPSG